MQPWWAEETLSKTLQSLNPRFWTVVYLKISALTLCLLLCFTGKRTACRFGIMWRWVNNNRIRTVALTIRLFVPHWTWLDLHSSWQYQNARFRPYSDLAQLVFISHEQKCLHTSVRMIISEMISMRLINGWHAVREQALIVLLMDVSVTRLLFKLDVINCDRRCDGVVVKGQTD